MVSIFAIRHTHSLPIFIYTQGRKQAIFALFIHTIPPLTAFKRIRRRDAFRTPSLLQTSSIGRAFTMQPAEALSALDALVYLISLTHYFRFGWFRAYDTLLAQILYISMGFWFSILRAFIFSWFDRNDIFAIEKFLAEFQLLYKIKILMIFTFLFRGFICRRWLTISITPLLILYLRCKRPAHLFSFWSFSRDGNTRCRADETLDDASIMPALYADTTSMMPPSLMLRYSRRSLLPLASTRVFPLRISFSLRWIAHSYVSHSRPHISRIFIDARIIAHSCRFSGSFHDAWHSLGPPYSPASSSLIRFAVTFAHYAARRAIKRCHASITDEVYRYAFFGPHHCPGFMLAVSFFSRFDIFEDIKALKFRAAVIRYLLEIRPNTLFDIFDDRLISLILEELFILTHIAIPPLSLFRRLCAFWYARFLVYLPIAVGFRLSLASQRAFSSFHLHNVSFDDATSFLPDAWYYIWARFISSYVRVVHHAGQYKLLAHSILRSVASILLRQSSLIIIVDCAGIASILRR